MEAEEPAASEVAAPIEAGAEGNGAAQPAPAAAIQPLSAAEIRVPARPEAESKRASGGNGRGATLFSSSERRSGTFGRRHYDFEAGGRK